MDPRVPADLDLGEEQLEAAPAQLGMVLADRRQRRIEELAVRTVVEADDAHVLRDASSRLVESAQDAQCHLIVGDEDRRHVGSGGEPAPELESVIPQRAGHNDIRRNNLELVLRHLATVGPDSRAAIAARAGLTRATVSRLVAELIALGVVRETGRDGGGRAGRPSTCLELGSGVVAIGTEVNVDYLSVLVIDLAGREVLRERSAFDASVGPDACIAALAELCRRTRRRLASRCGRPAPVVAGLTVAVPGLVDVAAGVVAEAPNLRWRDVAVAAPLRRALRLGPPRSTSGTTRTSRRSPSTGPASGRGRRTWSTSRARSGSAAASSSEASRCSAPAGTVARSDT